MYVYKFGVSYTPFSTVVPDLLKRKDEIETNEKIAKIKRSNLRQEVMIVLVFFYC